jgi:hypothetical protein
MAPLGEARERGREDLVATRAEQLRHLPPNPAALPAAVDENENRHAQPHETALVIVQASTKRHGLDCFRAVAV